MDIIDIKSSAKARGLRLNSLRGMVRLSRKDMETKYHISASTLQSWEDGKAGGLTKKGAVRVIAAFEKEGVRVTENWLLYGIGAGPRANDKAYHKGLVSMDDEPTASAESIPDDAAISRELLEFRRANADAIDMVVLGDEMAPEYLPGDYVAGRRRYHRSIEQAVGLDCIVETAMGDVLLRRLKRGNREGLYTLVCSNVMGNLTNPVLYDIEVLSCAPVTWRRRKDPIG